MDFTPYQSLTFYLPNMPIFKPHWDLPSSPVVNILPSNTGVRVQSLVRELRSYMPCGQKNQNRSNIVTNSIKTLKMVHIKKKSLKKVNKKINLIISYFLNSS